MRQLSSRLLGGALLAAVTFPLLAATYIVPPDREMIQRADDIVVATSVTSTVERTARGGIVTRYILRIEDVLKGERERGSYVTLTELGGELADRTLYVSGMPVYEPGKRYLVFTDANHDGDPETWGLELGQFALQNDANGRLLALRNAGGYTPNMDAFSEPPARDAREFMKYIRALMAQRTNPTPTYFMQSIPQGAKTDAKLVENFTRGSYLVAGNPRWQSTPNSALKTAGTVTGANGVTSVDNAIAQWNGTAVSPPIHYTNAGVDNTATAGFTSYDGQDIVLFGDPNDEVHSPVIARGGYWTSNTTYVLGGETFKDIDGGIDIVVDNISFTQALLNDTITHEMGHTFGFRHSNQNPDNSVPCNTTVNDCTTDAIMNGSVSGGFNGVLRTWDQTAAGVSYGAGPQCTNVTIFTQSSNPTITQGQSTSLSVTPGGTSPFTYQWYFGNPPITASPVPGGTTNPLSVSPSTTTTYWVRVTGCNSSTADSGPITVTVNPPTCTPPGISSQPLNQSITNGNSASLAVGATGTGPLVYQWYIGTTGNTSQFAGSGNPLQVAPNVTTQYWVRVTGNCGSPADSNPATITVTQGNSCPDVSVGTPTAAKQLNGTYLLDVIASSGTRPLTYAWFQGTAPGLGSFIGNGQQIVVAAPSAAVSYWVRVSNDCGQFATSRTVVTIAPCDLPVIGIEPSDQTIANGASATLAVAFTSASTAVVHWYRGIAPDKSVPIGIGTSISSGPLTATTMFWASIVNTCGERSTRTVTITVGTTCTKPAITNTPAAQSKSAGQTVTLSIVATGTAPLHYHWFQGLTGDESHAVGTDSATFISAPLSASAKFWVKVSNGCGDASSNTISVDVSAPKLRSVRH
jgi:hypothetical protein